MLADLLAFLRQALLGELPLDRLALGPRVGVLLGHVRRDALGPLPAGRTLDEMAEEES